MRSERSEAMNLMRIGVVFAWLGGLVMVGCATQPPFPDSSLTGRVLEVKMDDPLTPNEITAKQGDEIRWINTTGGSVDISFVEALNGRVSCQRGFVSAGWGYLFRGIASQPEFLVVATVRGHESASLCFSTPGTYAYTIRTETTGAGEAGRMAGTITID
jgi:plastocyanin